jgi:hypothetical protein
MLANRVQSEISRVFSHPQAAQAKRSEGVAYAQQEAEREVDVFRYVRGDASEPSGQADLHHRGHCLAVPSRRQIAWDGCPQNGQMLREDGLFLTTTSTHSEPQIKTLVSTEFHPEGLVKREASFAHDGVRARKVEVNYLHPQQNSVEEFFIAG